MFKEFWENLVPIKKVSNGHIIANCPICNELGGHFYANIQTGCWDCKKCQVSGNAWTFLRDHKQLTGSQIFQHLNKYGITNDRYFEQDYSAKPKYFDYQSIEYCCSKLTNEKKAEFAAERGLSIEILNKYRLGINDNDEFTLPIFDADGNVRNILRKKPGESTISSSGGEGLLFGIDDLIIEEKDIFVVEGPWSALALKERGYRAVGTCGAGILKDEQLSLFKNKKVYIVPDNDKPGKDGAEKIAGKLECIADDIYTINLPVPEKNDARNFFNSGGTIEQFEDLMQLSRDVSNSHSDANQVNLELLKETKAIDSVEVKRFLLLDDLPDGWLKDYVKFAYPLTEAPIQFHIATGLAIISTALGRNVYMKEGASVYYPNLYIVVVGASGTSKKSTATQMAFKFLNKMNPSIVLGSAGSLEAIQEAFQSNYCHLIIYDELKMISDNEEKSYSKGLVTFLTSIWSGPEQFRIDKKNIKEEKRILDSPTMNLICSTTPEWLQVKEVDILGGFLGRFLPICANASDKRLLPRRPPIDQEVFDSLYERLTQIRKVVTQEYTWTEESGLIFDGLYRQLDENFAKEKNISQIRPYWSRIDTHIRKLAMIFDIAGENPTYTITKDNLIRAWNVMETITGYYREMLSGLTFSWADKKEQQIAEALKKARPGGIKHSELMRNMHLTAKGMTEIINNLLEKEIIIAKHDKLSQKTTKVYYLK